jgi:hypothetical protein
MPLELLCESAHDRVDLDFPTPFPDSFPKLPQEKKGVSWVYGVGDRLFKYWKFSTIP